MFDWLRKNKKLLAAKSEAYQAGYAQGQKFATKNAFKEGYRCGKNEKQGNLRQAYENEIRHLKWVVSKLESKPEGERDGDIAKQNVARAVEDWLYGAFQKVSKDDIQNAKDELLDVLINHLRAMAQNEDFWIVKAAENDQATVAWKIAFPHMEPEKDYKQRMMEEYWQTKSRYSKIHDICTKYEAGTLDFTPTCSLELLTKQKAAMGNYLHCLEVRAQIEGVQL